MKKWATRYSGIDMKVKLDWCSFQTFSAYDMLKIFPFYFRDLPLSHKYVNVFMNLMYIGGLLHWALHLIYESAEYVIALATTSIRDTTLGFNLNLVTGQPTFVNWTTRNLFSKDFALRRNWFSNLRVLYELFICHIP